jgi:hypothetical protein
MRKSKKKVSARDYAQKLDFFLVDLRVLKLHASKINFLVKTVNC